MLSVKIEDDNTNTGFEEFGLIEEDCRLNLVKAIVDSACGMIVSGAVLKSDYKRLAKFVKSSVMTFVPGQEEKYDMIYGARINRYIEQFSKKD